MGYKRQTVTDYLNNLTSSVLYQRYKNIALNIFEWKNLPENIKEEYLENILYQHGQAVFFNDSKHGLMCLQAVADYGVNVYGYPTSYRAVGFGYETKVDIEKAVLIQNNKLREPTHPTVLYYTNKLYEIERTCDVNIKSLKAPVLMLTNEKTLLSAKILFDKIDGNEPVIFGSNSINVDDVNVLDMKATFICDKLADYRHDLINEMLTWFGINNANTDKRERLLTGEVEANNEFIIMNGALMLECRKRACQQINEMFNLNVSVDYRIKQEGGQENVIESDEHKTINDPESDN